jgi:hypothetical protein
MSPQRLDKRRKDYCDCAWYSSFDKYKLLRPAKETIIFAIQYNKSCKYCQEYKQIELMAIAESL